MSDADERAKDVARGIALEKDAERAEVGVFMLVWLPLIVAGLMLGSAYTNWGGWGAIWVLIGATVIAAWAMKGVKAKALR